MKKWFQLYFVLISVSIFYGCAGSSISLVGGKNPGHPVNVIAINPNSGILGDAIAIEIASYDINVVDPAQLTNIVARLNLNEFEIGTPQNLLKLKDQGIDGYLVVKVASGYDGLPQSASVRLNSTYNGQLIAGVSWQNGYGGQATSMLDRAMRKDVSSAAKEIVAKLIKNIK
ncbi:MAG: hypothetical protein M0Q21_02875 [Ignavibacteriaceae bacterium]|nr:hypothetical protein [Ignavibacteriaceae bacterium]